VAYIFVRKKRERNSEVMRNNESLSVFNVEWKREAEKNASDECC